MASLNTVIAVAAGAAVIGTTVLVACSKSKTTNDKKPVKIAKVESKSQVAAQTKPKKKKNKKANKDANAAAPSSSVPTAPKPVVVSPVNNDDEDDDEDDSDDDFVPAPKAKAVAPVPEAKGTKPAPVASSSSSSSKPAAAPAPAPAPAPTPAPVAVAPVAAATSSDSEGKKKKPKETPEQKAARLERQKAAKEAAPQTEVKPAAASNSSESSTNSNQGVYSASTNYVGLPTHPSSTSPVDGWAVVDKKKPKVVPPAPVAAEQPASATSTPTPVLEVLKTQVTVDAKKVGLIVGPKGKTLHMIQDLFQVEIITPKESPVIAPPAPTRPGIPPPVVTSVITVQGTSSDNLNKAVRAINDLCTKSYCVALEGPDFKEGFIAVPPKNISDIIGKGGVVRRAIETHTNVRVIIPPNVARDSIQPVRVTLAGHHQKVAEAKKIIHDIIDTYHSEVTHPGQVHEEMPHVPSALYNQIIGAKGSEIRHIQNSYKVSVYIPGPDTSHKSIVIVGEPRGVASAVTHINKIVEKATQDKQAAEIANDTWKDHEEEEDQGMSDPFLSQYVLPNKLQAARMEASTGVSVLSSGPEETIMTFDSLPTLAGRSYANSASGTTTAASTNGTKPHNAWASVLAPSASEGW